MAKTIGPVERPIASRKSSVMDQSIRVCIKRQAGVAIRAESDSNATVSRCMACNAQKKLKGVALSDRNRYCCAGSSASCQMPMESLSPRQMPKKSHPMPTKEELDAIWRYDSSTGEFFWKIHLPSRKIHKGRKAGVVGGRQGNNYIRLNFNKRRLQAHRVAWVIFYNEDPGNLLVDHINGDRLDNRICNLRLATVSQNAFNRKINKNNTSGYKSVQNSGILSKPFEAVLYYQNDKKRLGYFASAAEAADAVNQEKMRLHGEFFRES